MTSPSKRKGDRAEREEDMLRQEIADLIATAIRDAFPGSVAIRVPNHTYVGVVLAEVAGTRHHIRVVDVRGMEHDYFARASGNEAADAWGQE